MITICLFSIELEILHNRIWDICSVYAVQVLLSPMVPGWAVGRSLGQLGGLVQYKLVPALSHKS